jgi:hypothetical protein
MPCDAPIFHKKVLPANGIRVKSDLGTSFLCRQRRFFDG